METTAGCPSLESLCLDAVASNLHNYEPTALELPLGGGSRIIERLARTNRLRPETLQPLLNSDWASESELQETLGVSLVAAAPGCRGLSALAAHRISFRAAGHEPYSSSTLPVGTRSTSSLPSEAALAAR